MVVPFSSASVFSTTNALKEPNVIVVSPIGAAVGPTPTRVFAFLAMVLGPSNTPDFETSSRGLCYIFTARVKRLSCPGTIDVSVYFLTTKMVVAPSPPWVFYMATIVFSSVIMSESWRGIGSPFSSSREHAASFTGSSPPLPPSTRAIRDAALAPDSLRFSVVGLVSLSMSIKGQFATAARKDLCAFLVLRA